MHTKLIVLLIALIPLVDFSNGQIVDDGCYKVPLIENFDINKLAGTWYLQEVGDDDEAHKNCLYYNVTLDHKETGTTASLKPIYERNNNKDETFQTFEVKDTNQLVVFWKGKQRFAWTVAVDYSSWTASYICIPEEKDKGIVYISTRSKHPSNRVLEESHKALKKLGFDISKPYLHVLDRETC